MNNDTPIPCPECGSTNWERIVQHLVNETEMLDTSLPISYGPNGENPYISDVDTINSEVNTDWRCWPNKHNPSDEISDRLAEFTE